MHIPAPGIPEITNKFGCRAIEGLAAAASCLVNKCTTTSVSTLTLSPTGHSPPPPVNPHHHITTTITIPSKPLSNSSAPSHTPSASQPNPIPHAQPAISTFATIARSPPRPSSPSCTRTTPTPMPTRHFLTHQTPPHTPHHNTTRAKQTSACLPGRGGVIT